MEATHKQLESIEDIRTHVETALKRELTKSIGETTPPKLASAMRYALFPGGGRVRPLICLEVARACGDAHPDLADAAAVSLEMVHCASLAQDDMPCFDNSSLRRGRKTLHLVFGPEIGILVGDALIIVAFQVLGRLGARNPEHLPALIELLGRAVGPAEGLVAGQAWESEPSVDLGVYHTAKTAGLFTSATMMGALAGGQNPELWRDVGHYIGLAYQIADDISDQFGDSVAMGKPIGVDAHLVRPNSVRARGLDEAVSELEHAARAAQDAIPECENRLSLIALVDRVTKRLVPKNGVARDQPEKNVCDSADVLGVEDACVPHCGRTQNNA